MCIKSRYNLAGLVCQMQFQYILMYSSIKRNLSVLYRRFATQNITITSTNLNADIIEATLRFIRWAWDALAIACGKQIEMKAKYLLTLIQA